MDFATQVRVTCYMSLVKWGYVPVASKISLNIYLKLTLAVDFASEKLS